MITIVTSHMNDKKRWLSRMRNKTRASVAMIRRTLMIKMLAGSVRYQTLRSIACLLNSLSSALGNALLNSPQNHTSGISISLLKSHLGLSILLLNQYAKVPLSMALSIFFNRQSPTFQLTINTQTRQNWVAVSLLPTANFKYPKNEF